MQVRVHTQSPDHKLLFKWDTDNDVIEIVHKKELIRCSLRKTQIGERIEFLTAD